MSRQFDVTSVGETMIRLSVPPREYFTAATHFDVDVGGAESNVTTTLSRLGRPCGWLGAVPDDARGRLVTTRLAAAGVDTRAVRRLEGSRLGMYFLDTSPPPKNTSVVYDRAASAFSTFSIRDRELDYLFDTRVVHLTGITPSLGAAPRASFERVLEEAQDRGVTISFDVNYRERMWPPEEAKPVLLAALARGHVVFCSFRDVQRLFGPAEDAAGALNRLQEHTDAEWIVVTVGEGGVHARGPEGDVSAAAVATSVVDRPGAGDALAAGVLDGYLEGDLQAGLARGTHLASICLSHRGDMVNTDRHELEALLARGSADIVR